MSGRKSIDIDSYNLLRERYEAGCLQAHYMILLPWVLFLSAHTNYHSEHSRGPHGFSTRIKFIVEK